jgi:hypothetical protein
MKRAAHVAARDGTRRGPPRIGSACARQDAGHFDKFAEHPADGDILVASVKIRAPNVRFLSWGLFTSRAFHTE